MKKQPEETEDTFDTEDEPSKSQRKRDALQAVELAKLLLQLSPAKRARLQLAVEITDALTLADGIRSNGARKRQLQYIGKLLRGSADYESYWRRYENPQLLDETTNTAESQSPEPSADLQMLDRLLEDLAATMDELRVQYPNANVQHIRQLVSRINKLNNQAAIDPKEQRKLMKSLATALREGRDY